MRSRMWMTLGVAGVLLAAPLAHAAAQATTLRELPTTGRLVVDGYVSRYRLALPDARTRLDGMGGRVMWALAPTRGPRRERLAEHLAIGAFVARTPVDGVANGGEVRTTVYGAQVDVRPLRAPIGGMIEPVLSLGAGAMSVRRSMPGPWTVGDGIMLFPRDVPSISIPAATEGRSTHAMLAPAVGLLIAPRPNFALRLDVRQLRSRRERAVEIATGVSLKL